MWMREVTHVYVEDSVCDHPTTAQILSRLPWTRVIAVRDHREVFNRYGQSFQIQKRSQKLILAKKTGRFVYQGTERIAGSLSSLIHYVDPVRNCPFNCDYCFLQGMHPSANLLINVNTEDYLAAVTAALEDGPLYVSLSYLTDILALEPLLPLTRQWIEFCRAQQGLTLEVRTKSESFPAIADLAPAPGVILAFSLTPPVYAGNHEVGTAGFQNRLFSAYRAATAGWRVRLCFDPVIIDSGWEEAYKDAIRTVFARLPADSVEEVSIGVFRVHKDHLKRMRKVRKDAAILYGNYDLEGSVVAPDARLRGHVESHLRAQLAPHLPDHRIRFVHG